MHRLRTDIANLQHQVLRQFALHVQVVLIGLAIFCVGINALDKWKAEIHERLEDWEGRNRWDRRNEWALQRSRSIWRPGIKLRESEWRLSQHRFWQISGVAIEVNTKAAAQHRLRRMGYFPSQAKTWRYIPIRSSVVAGIRRLHHPVRNRTAEIRSHGKTAQGSGVRQDALDRQGRVEVAQPPIYVARCAEDFITHARVYRQPWRDFEVLLRKCCEVGVPLV